MQTFNQASDECFIATALPTDLRCVDD